MVLFPAHKVMADASATATKDHLSQLEIRIHAPTADEDLAAKTTRTTEAGVQHELPAITNPSQKLGESAMKAQVIIEQPSITTESPIEIE